MVQQMSLGSNAACRRWRPHGSIHMCSPISLPIHQHNPARGVLMPPKHLDRPRYLDHLGTAPYVCAWEFFDPTNQRSATCNRHWTPKSLGWYKYWVLPTKLTLTTTTHILQSIAQATYCTCRLPSQFSKSRIISAMATTTKPTIIVRITCTQNPRMSTLS